MLLPHSQSRQALLYLARVHHSPMLSRDQLGFLLSHLVLENLPRHQHVQPQSLEVYLPDWHLILKNKLKLLKTIPFSTQPLLSICMNITDCMSISIKNENLLAINFD